MKTHADRINLTIAMRGYPYGVETKTLGEFGSPRGVTHLHGPFETQAAAIEYAKAMVKDGDYDYVKVVKIETPAAGPTWSAQHGWNG